jgi:hypothetical protein
MRALATAALLSSLSLGGCATSSAGSSPMDARAEAPAPPKTSGYPAVEDLPPKREKPAMTADERLKLQKELTAARDRQAPNGKAKGGAASPSTHEEALKPARWVGRQALPGGPLPEAYPEKNSNLGRCRT